MKTLLATVMIFVCLFHASAEEAVQNKLKKETVVKTKISDDKKESGQVVTIKQNDISISSELKQKVYLADEAIEFTVKLTNDSKEDISFVSTNIFGDFSWNVIDIATQKNVPYTQLGKNAVDPYRRIFRCIEIIVSYGKDYCISFDIAPYFDFQPGGKYELNFGGSFQQDGKKVDYQLKGLTIEIAPATNVDESNKGYL